jgi:preprotein translocase subunit YajC
MGTNWIILAIVLLAIIGFILFLILRNQKDKKEITTTLNADTELEDDYERDKDRE